MLNIGGNYENGSILFNGGFIFYIISGSHYSNTKWKIFIFIFCAYVLGDRFKSPRSRIVLGAISLVKLIIDIAFTSTEKNLIACFFFSLGLFTITNLLMIKEKAAIWVDIGNSFMSFVILFWILNLFDLIQISYLRHFFFVHFIQKRQEEKRRKKDNKGKKGKKEE